MENANVINFEDAVRWLAGELKNETLQFQDFARRLRELAEFKGSEKREADRTELQPIPADVQPLDEAFEPEGEAFFAIVRNVSSHGIGMMFGRPVHTKYLQIQVKTPDGDNLRTVIEVKHCTENGTMIGGRAVTQLRLM